MKLSVQALRSLIKEAINEARGGMFKDSKEGALQALSASHGIEWEPYEVKSMMDPEVDGVWMLVNPAERLGFVVNSLTGEVLDELEGGWPNSPYDKMMKRYGKQLR